LILLATLVVGLVGAYRDMFAVCARAWGDAQYSHGWLIPVFTLVMLWIRREHFEPVPAWERWVGVGLLVFSVAIRIWSGMVYMVPLDMLSFLAAVFGVFVLVGGFHVLRWAGWWLTFLIFMFPLPAVLERHVLGRLRTYATIVSMHVLQTLGFSSYREGNLLYIDSTPVQIADECAGLRMATIFGAMAVAIVLLVRRPWWDKLIILISAIPIALFVNIIRVTVTAFLFWAYPDSELIHKLVHDGAGYVMPILALGLLWLELVILEKLTIIDEGEQLASIGVGGPRPPGRTSPIPRPPV
jgi:exosortase